MKRLLKLNNEFWTHERSLTALLIYLALAVFLWMPLANYRWWGFFISDLLFNLILLSGVYAVLTRRRRQILFITIALLASSFRIFSFFMESEWVTAVNYGITILFLVVLVNMVLRHIFKEGPVNYYRIQGSIVIYMLTGIVWAFLFSLLELLVPGSFTYTGSSVEVAEPFSQFLYFSFVTMTTLGYGDMVPAHPIAKSLVIFEGMFGLLYPVIMIARLVSMEVEHSRGARGDR
jgi:hypothetical protein